MLEPDYINKNRESWNKRTDYHINSAFYDVAGFIAGNSSLNDIELKLLGDVKGKSILHLQCHFGQDTLSMARLGAHVTGVDLSDKAIEQARLLAHKAGLHANFVCCDLYALPLHLDGTFDYVFTSYGTIGWLPDLDKWAQIIARYLKPGAELVFVDFHPVVWMYDNDFEKVTYNYFNTGPIFEKESGTYADRKAPIQTDNVGWNHGISEILESLLKNGLTLSSFREYDYSPYNCFNNMLEFEPGKYRINHMENKLPMVFSLQARK